MLATGPLRSLGTLERQRQCRQWGKGPIRRRRGGQRRGNVQGQGRGACPRRADRHRRGRYPRRGNPNYAAASGSPPARDRRPQPRGNAVAGRHRPARRRAPHRTAPARWSRKFPSANCLPCIQQMAASLPETAIAHFVRKTWLAPVGVRSTAPVVQAAGSLHGPVQSVKENQDTPTHNDPQGTG